MNKFINLGKSHRILEFVIHEPSSIRYNLSMTHHALTNSLNDHQLAAVTAPFDEHLLILAGAGSGKTRVLTHRMAWLIDQGQVSPHHIFAVTFTNKAAIEMRHRVGELLNLPTHALWIGTFHGLAHRFLRLHHQEAGLPAEFQILDHDDQFRLVKRLQRQLNISEEQHPVKNFQRFIAGQKEKGHRASDSEKSSAHHPFARTAQAVYALYEKTCQQDGLVDFSELLLRSLELLENNEALRAHYQHRFVYVLIDEFQDTNAIQYRWLRTLAGPSNYFMAVGDDDQSIYSWRGARVENIQHFMLDFKPLNTIRLEQNYRSTQTILSAANALIDHNSNRMGKELWSDGSSGDPISVYAGYDEYDEAHYIAKRIQEWTAAGQSYSDLAVLYRSNAQSRVLEECLINKNIPYRIYGGLKFFERAEIKDALAYLRLVLNRHDDVAFDRIVNTPTRGIGQATLALVRARAKETSVSFWQAAHHLIEENALTARAVNALCGFINLIDELEVNTRELPLSQQVKIILEGSRLVEFYKKDRSEKSATREDNLEELINATAQFSAPEALGTEIPLSPLAAFLSHVALEGGDRGLDEPGRAVNLMTLHSAKGLEFPCVIIAGLEESLFPHRMSMTERDGLEEERRLCYVGMTRAMHQLILTYAENRRLHGLTKSSAPSRFLSEIPEELLRLDRPAPKLSRPIFSSQFKESRVLAEAEIGGEEGSLSIGQRVMHHKFGQGVIINYEGAGEHLRLQVKFDRYGSKWLVSSFAKLEPCF